MRTRLSISVLALVVVVAALGAALAHAGGPESPDELLARYQPVLVLDRTERFAPSPVEPFVEASVLERLGDTGWAQPEKEPHKLPKDGDGWRLNHPCSPASGLASVACYAAGPAPPPVVYGRHEVRQGTVILQYWMFYGFNFWSLQYPATDFVWQAHEGDWEVVTIVLDRQREPVQAGYSQHCGGERRDWAAVPRAPGSDHPLVYVGTGSHANLFAPGTHAIDLACYPQQAVAFFQAYHVTPLDVNAPGTVLGPEQASLERVHDHHPRWLQFPGTWGETQYVHGPAPFGTIQYGTSPVGPAFQSEWDDPLGTVAGYRAG